MNKTYLEFGSLVRSSKKKYETLYNSKSFNLYDAYMFSRYFRDIYVLEHNKNFKQLKTQLHDIKDLKFSFVIYILLLSTKVEKYYEFGSTIFERYFYIKFLENKFSKKTKLNRYYGNDISKFFNYFSNKFFSKKFNCFASEKFEKKLVSKSIFFSKGISLLYEKNNKKILEKIFLNSTAGFFDFSIMKENKIKFLNTGKKLYYLGYKNFKKILNKNKNKYFYFRKIKYKNNKIYFECIFGGENILRDFEKLKKKLRVNKKDKKNLDYDFKFINKKKYSNKIEKIFNLN